MSYYVILLKKIGMLIKSYLKNKWCKILGGIMMLKITNTLTGKKETFQPLHKNKVSMYVCGVTPYDVAHIGHGRCYVSFDVFYRLLRYLGNDIRYCRNITDIDDKILRKAQEQFGSRLKYAEITGPLVQAFKEDLEQLNCLPPDFEPRVTDNIPAIITFIANLIDAGKAYAVDGDVYFNIREYPAYGALSKHNIEDLRSGARIEINEKKRDPLDFALWKSEPTGEFWDSPWGYGRPGWHIECSALAAKFLGQHIDVHAGGLDLMFPHHENEIAQSEALYGAPFAAYWMHNGLVKVNGEKMSKSLGNFFTLRDIFAQFDPVVIRYYFLTHHYRGPIDFSIQGLTAAQKSYQRLARIFTAVQCDPIKALSFAQPHTPVIDAFMDFLLDDMNTPGMFGVLFEQLDHLKDHTDELCQVKAFMQEVLGLVFKQLPEEEITITPEIAALIEQREQARVAKDFARADALRDQLRELGYQVQDKKTSAK